MPDHRNRVPLDFATLTVRLPAGAQELARLRCKRCGIPVVRATFKGRETTLNLDGTYHSKSCAGRRFRPRVMYQSMEGRHD